MSVRNGSVFEQALSEGLEDHHFPNYPTGCQVSVFLTGNTYLGDLGGIAYSITTSRKPIYSYRSRVYDKVTRGQKMVQGFLLVPLSDFRYLETAVGVGTGNLTEPEQAPSHIASKASARLIPDLSGLSQDEALIVLNQLGTSAFGSTDLRLLLAQTETVANLRNVVDHSDHFDLVIHAGDPNEYGSDWMTKRSSTSRRITGCFITGESTQIMMDDQPIALSYPFFARDMDYLSATDNPLQRIEEETIEYVNDVLRPLNEDLTALIAESQEAVEEALSPESPESEAPPATAPPEDPGQAMAQEDLEEARQLLDLAKEYYAVQDEIFYLLETGSLPEGSIYATAEEAREDLENRQRTLDAAMLAAGVEEIQVFYGDNTFDYRLPEENPSRFNEDRTLTRVQEDLEAIQAGDAEFLSPPSASGLFGQPVSEEDPEVAVEQPSGRVTTSDGSVISQLPSWSEDYTYRRVVEYAEEQTETPAPGAYGPGLGGTYLLEPQPAPKDNGQSPEYFEEGDSPALGYEPVNEANERGERFPISFFKNPVDKNRTQTPLPGAVVGLSGQVVTEPLSNPFQLPVQGGRRASRNGRAYTPRLG